MHAPSSIQSYFQKLKAMSGQNELTFFTSNYVATNWLMEDLDLWMSEEDLISFLQVEGRL